MTPSLFTDRSFVGQRDSSDDTRELTGRFEGEQILVPLLTSTVPAVSDQIRVATTLARGASATVSVINPVSVPEQTPKQLCQDIPDTDDDALLDWVVDQTTPATVAVEGAFLYTRNVVSGVVGTIRSRDIDTVVLPSEPQAGRFRRGVIERIGGQAPCDVVVVNGQAGYKPPISILVPIAGGPHSGLATDLAQSIASDCDAWIDLLHVIPADAPEREREQAEDLVDDAYHRIARPQATTTWILEANDVVDAIIEQSRYYDLTVIGAATKGRLQRFIYGSTSHTVRSNAQSMVLSARNNRNNGGNHRL